MGAEEEALKELRQIMRDYMRSLERRQLADPAEETEPAPKQYRLDEKENEEWK